MDITHDDEALTRLLGSRRRIAVVGASPDPGRPSNRIYRFLRDAGHDVLPVNPVAPEIEGVVPVKDLAEAAARWGAPAEIVDVFRAPAHLQRVVEEVVEAQAPYLWTQLGVVEPTALQAAEDAGLTMVVDRCILVEASRLGLTSV